MNEDEQVEALKRWWDSYGKMVLIILALSIVFVIGYQYWQKNQYKKLSQSSELFSDIIEKVQLSDNQTAKAEANYLLDKYPDTIYAGVSALVLAQLAVDEGDLTTANQYLKSSEKHSKPTVFKEITRIRQARVLAALEKNDEALQLLANIDDATFKSLVDSVKGDILLQQGKIKEAKKMYQQALSENSVAQQNELIEMKLANIPGDIA